MSEQAAEPTPEPVLPTQSDWEKSREARKAVVERVRKYKALTASDNENEARIAAKKMADLVKEHMVTDLEIRGESFTDVMEHAVDGNFDQSWRIALLTAIAQSCHARALRVREVILKDGKPTDFWHGRVIALNSDIDGIVYLFAYYESAVNEMVKLHGYDKATESEEDSYRRGLVYSLQGRFIPAEQTSSKVAQATTAMSKTPQTKKETASFVEKKYTRIGKDTDLGGVKDRRTFYEGVDDARLIPLAGIHRKTPRTKIDSAPEPQEDKQETP